MDSFNIMGQFDSMLPPGDVYRKTFDTALMGLESKGGGGGGGGGDDAEDRWEDQADLAHEQNMNTYNYNADSADRAYNHQVLQNEHQRREMLEQHMFQTGEREQQWMYAQAVKEQEYNAQMGAYNKSEEMYGHQVKMNQVAANMAMDAQNAQKRERDQAVAFEAAKAVGTFGKESMDLALRGAKTDLDYAATKADLALQGQGVDLDIYSKRTAASRQKQELTIKEQTKRGGAALESVENVVKGMQASGQAKARGQAGRSAEKQYQALAAASGRLQAAKAYELNRSDLATSLALKGVDQTMREQEAAATLAHTKIGVNGIQADAGYDISMKELDNATSYLNEMFDIGAEERAATSLSIRGEYGRSMDKILYDQYSANVKADFNRMSEPSMGVPIPKPLELPMATLLDPPIPVKGHEPVWGAGMGPVPQEGRQGSGGSGFFGGMMTGASMGAAGGWWGAGIGAVVGGIGGAFGWI